MHHSGVSWNFGVGLYLFQFPKPFLCLFGSVSGLLVRVSPGLVSVHKCNVRILFFSCLLARISLPIFGQPAALFPSFSGQKLGFLSEFSSVPLGPSLGFRSERKATEKVTEKFPHILPDRSGLFLLTLAREASFTKS